MLGKEVYVGRRAELSMDDEMEMGVESGGGASFEIKSRRLVVFP